MKIQDLKSLARLVEDRDKLFSALEMIQGHGEPIVRMTVGSPIHFRQFQVSVGLFEALVSDQIELIDGTLEKLGIDIADNVADGEKQN